MKSMLITMLVFYIGICVVLFVLQRKFLYFPQPAASVNGVASISFDSMVNSYVAGLLTKGALRR